MRIGMGFAVLGVLCALVAGRSASAAYHSEPPVDPLSSEAPLVPWSQVWTQRRVANGIVYFLDRVGQRVRRFDAAANTWLADVALGGAADAFDVDASGIYLKFPDRIERRGHDGSVFVYAQTDPGTGAMIEVIGNVFLLGDSADSRVRSHDKATGAEVSSIPIWHDFTGTSGIDGEGRVFGRTNGVSPSDIVAVKLDPSGHLLGYFDSPYHGDLPPASQTFAREAGGMVADDAGIVYDSDDLSYMGSLGGPVSGIAWLGDGFVALRAGSLSLFSNDLREIGRIAAPDHLLDVVAVGATVYGISGSIGSLVMTPIDLGTAAPPVPPPARGWVEAGAHADEILGDGEQLVLVNRVAHAAYAFRPQDWSFGAPVPLFVNPLHAAYSRVDDRIYAAYAGGTIHAFPMDQPGTAEWFTATPLTPFGLATAGEYLFAGDYSGAWSTHYVFSPAGDMLSNPDWNYFSRQFEWDPVMRRMYFLRDDTSPNDLHFEQISLAGTIVGEGETPYHGDYAFDVPIRVSPAGSRVALGSGLVLETAGLTVVGIIDAAADIGWLFGDLYAITRDAEPRLQRYDAGYNVVSSGRVRGTPRRMLPSGSGFVYIADVGASTIIGRLDGFLSKSDLAVDPMSPGSIFAKGSIVTLHVVVGNNGVVPSDGATVTADLSALANASWRCVPVAFVAGCDGIVQTGALIDVIDLGDGGSAMYEITGRIPAGGEADTFVPVAVQPANATTDPELRNNAHVVRIPMDRLFTDGFD